MNELFIKIGRTFVDNLADPGRPMQTQADSCRSRPGAVEGHELCMVDTAEKGNGAGHGHG